MSRQGPSFERRWGDYVISDDRGRFDRDALHDFLEREGYWARGRSREATATAVDNSVVLGVYRPDDSMVGGVRIVTDRATFGWLTDVYVLAEHRGLGLGQAMVAAACEHPAVAGIKRLMLITADAHELYRPLGFDGLRDPERWMELRPVPGSEASGAAGAGASGGGRDAARGAGAADGTAGGASGAADSMGSDAGASGGALGTASHTGAAGSASGDGRADDAGGAADGAAGDGSGAGAAAAGHGAGTAGSRAAATEEAHLSSEPGPHVAWQGDGLPDPRTAPVWQIAGHLLEIVSSEGPVTADRAYRLYIRGAGCSTLTQRVRAPMEQALDRLTLRGQVEIDELDNAGESQQVLRLPDRPTVVLRDLGERSLYEVPINEIAEIMGRKRAELTGRAVRARPVHAVAGVIQQAALRRASPDRLKRAVLDAYGLIRMTQASEQYLSSALALLDKPEA